MQKYEKSIARTIYNHFIEVDSAVNSCAKLQELKKEYYQALNEVYSGADVIFKNPFKYRAKKDKTESKYKELKNDIGTYCDGLKTIEPLSVGIFGVWGSGKTYILKGIKEEINTRQEQNIVLWDSTKENEEFEKIDELKPIIVPVFFNAWRFEKEEHIIIPLFQTLVSALSEYEHISLMQKIYAKAKLFSYALAKGLQAPSEVPDIKKLFSGDIKELKKIASFFNWKKVLEESDYKSMLDALLRDNRIESVYLNIPQWIEKMLLLDNVRFLFLIDDLDRCLPENALKMLESIKLFLDVAGCSFVLALDDDVIERGVEHNYKEYKLDGNNATLPITGSEYLEKIIQLPFRIPPKDNDDISKLLEKYSDIFIEKVPKNSNNKEQEPQYIEKENSELKKLFIKAVPPYPRKVIRAVTLYKSKLDVIKDFDSSIDKILVAKITFLELFAPKLYRFIKDNEHLLVLKRVTQFLKDVKYLTETKKMQAYVDTEIKAQKEKERTITLIKIIEELNNSRVDFDLDKIFANIDISTQEEKIDSYIKLKRIEKKQTIVLDDKDIEFKEPTDKELFEKYLFSNDPVSWERAFTNETGLESAYIKIDDDFIDKAKEYVTNPKWLEIVASHTSRKDFLSLVNKSKVVTSILKEPEEPKNG